MRGKNRVVASEGDGEVEGAKKLRFARCSI